MNKKYPHLFQPLTIRGTTIKNRLEAAPVSVYDLSTTVDKHLSKDGVGFYRLRAAGGASIVTIGDAIVHPTGMDTGHLPSPKILICHEDNIPFLTDVTDEIHRYGTIANIQLNHAGMLSTSEEFSGFGPDDIDFSVVQAPVPLADQGKEGMDFSRKGKVRAMDEEMIETIVDAYGQSALRAKECGFDMVQVHAGHGWLIHQFLSPLTNHRTDRFGGSTENRGRFLKMVIERIRQYCGEDLLIEMRMSGSDNTEGGYDVHEAVEFAKMVEDDVDIIHVSTGNFYYPDTDVDMIPTVFTEWGHNIYLAKEMKKHITKAKIATVGAIMEPSFMEKTLAEGSADLVVVGRALVADPELPNKARRGQEQEIRPCLRCCFCLSDYQSRWLHCTVNPTIYRPYETLYMNPPASKKKVLIAGGGVAGMQAAVTAAERGHGVILCEKTDRLGGLIRYARSVDFKYDTRRYLDHMIAKVYRRGVDVRLLCEVTPELIEEIKPDHVIAAVGSTHIVPNIPGCERAIPIMEYYDNAPYLGEEVAVIGAGLSGSELALELAMKGKKVTLIEGRGDFAVDANDIHKSALKRQFMLNKERITLLTDTLCRSIEDGTVICQDKDGKEIAVKADSVVLACGMKSLKETVDALWDVCDEFDYIGDCRKPRTIRHAVTEGYNAAMNV